MQISRRIVLTAATVVATLALVAAEAAVGVSDTALAGSGSASASACPGSQSLKATRAERSAALLCLINHARAAAGLRRVRKSAKLTRVAHAKGRDVVECSDFDHTACGNAPFVHVASTGFRFRRVGENLFLAQRPTGTAYDAFVAWLNSPAHRELLFLPAFSHAGAAVFRLKRLSNTPRAELWVLELAQKAS